MRATIYKHPTMSNYKVLVNGTVYWYSSRQGWKRSKWSPAAMGSFKLCCHVNNFKLFGNVQA